VESLAASFNLVLVSLFTRANPSKLPAKTERLCDDATSAPATAMTNKVATKVSITRISAEGKRSLVKRVNIIENLRSRQKPLAGR
jgi:hypothetical protein